MIPTGQLIYCGPMIPSLGLQHGTIFRNGIHSQHILAIEQCPSLGGLFVRVSEYAAVRRELNFDIARNMRGTKGKHVTFYRETQKWLTSRREPVSVVTTGVKTHAR
jgi:hypothetical protein